jgi:3-isopropylmalate/(R)-2-methylmalate dehydratase large subunit
MGMTITEKILAKSAGKKVVVPGDNIWLNVDILMTHDVCGPPAIEIWKREFGEKAKVWDINKLAIIPDHYIFTANKQANRNVEIVREFAKKYNLKNYYDPGTSNYKGVCHVALAEESFNIPGTVIFGTDSHTCTSGAFGLFSTGVGNTDAAFILGTGKIWERTPESMKFIINGELPEYLTGKDLILHIIGGISTDGATNRAMEFCGDTIQSLCMDEKMTITNMAIEAGAMNGIIPVDDITKEYLKKRTDKSYEIFNSDSDAKYHSVYKYLTAAIEPTVAKPHSPGNRDTAKNLKGTKITKSYIGSCTGGKLTDFINAAKILINGKVKVPTFIIPATTEVEKNLNEEKIKGKTLRSIFEESGCTISKPSCAACLGGPEDTIGRAMDGDITISTTNRNFHGRMGSKKSEVYLASPLTVAASALKGSITDPREFLK